MKAVVFVEKKLFNLFADDAIIVGFFARVHLLFPFSLKGSAWNAAKYHNLV